MKSQDKQFVREVHIWELSSLINQYYHLHLNNYDGIIFRMLVKALLILTIFHCCPEDSRTIWSITSRSKGQHFKFIFCVFVKVVNSCCWCLSIVNSQGGCRTQVILFIIQFKSFDDSMSEVFWWKLPWSCNTGWRVHCDDELWGRLWRSCNWAVMF